MKKRYNRRSRLIAGTLLSVLLFDITAPNIALAVSSGASQAEFNGYTSGSVTELVDPFTGDFSYNIPLMTVPGTDGGYPIVLSYNAGIGMNDEASWVGLGWTLNPGVINRSMRGLPDEFKGDPVIQKNYIRPDNTVELMLSTDLVGLLPEAAGFDASLLANNLSLPLSYCMYYNTYRGLGSRLGAGLSLHGGNAMFNGGIGLNASFDSNEGAAVQGDISLGLQLGLLNFGLGLGGAATAREGITSVTRNTTFGISAFKNNLWGQGGTFSTSSHIPVPPYQMTGFNAALKLDFEAGALSTTLNVPVSLQASYSSSKIQGTVRQLNGYGYMYAHGAYQGAEASNDLMDFNRENDREITMKSPFIPNPIATYDVYGLKDIGGGGSFRLHRNDAGIYHDPSTVNSTGGGTVGFEVAASTGFKVAADIDINYTESYTGKWVDGLDEIQDKLGFRDEAAYNDYSSGGTYVRRNAPYYFRFLNENTRMVNASGFRAFRQEAPYTIALGMMQKGSQSIDGGMGEFIGKISENLKPVFVAKALNASQGVPVPQYKKQKELSNTVVGYRTRAEVTQGASAGFPLPKINSSASSVDLSATANNYFNGLSAYTYPATHIRNHHIAEFSILTPGGEIQKYGLPAYVRKHNDHYFSYGNNGDGQDSRSPAPVISQDYTAFDASYEKYYHANELPPYAHSYLLTEVYSPDYVDISSDGPSSDDYGDFTKFNYKLHSSAFKWRIPYSGAINMKGHLSAGYDNKASISYGEKELWYVQSVETKTHIAFFLTSNRNDGSMAANELYGGRDGSTVKLQKLDRIVLFSKEELRYAIDNSQVPVPLQQVYFSYSYDLCPDTPSNDGASLGSHPDADIDPSLTNANAKKGKLTLEKVEIRYGNSSKGQLTPYRFNYGDVNSADDNPSYAFGHHDRWGTYRNVNRTVSASVLGGSALRNTDETFPYVQQAYGQKAILDKEAGAWCLKEIVKPSGGKVHVEYECDDYSHVQDKKAQQMFKIIGVGLHGTDRSTSGTDPLHQNINVSKDDMFVLGKNNLPLNKKNRRIYFDPETPISASLSDSEIKEQVRKYAASIMESDSLLYFKTWQRLQVPKDYIAAGGWAYDYVEGYCKIEAVNYAILGGDKVVPYVVVQNMHVAGRNFHPFKLAGLQYLRYSRGDLSTLHGDASGAAINIIMSSVSFITSGMEMLSGYYNWAIMRGHCEQIGDQEASYIRLDSPDGIKYGGGHRVRSIYVNDSWGDQSAESIGNSSYTENYYYKSLEGRETTSSGVAAYEPVTGGEENAMKRPVYFGRDNKFANKELPYFQHLPVLEGLYPAASVGYRDVSVITSATEQYPETGDGFARYTFNTYKDYPVYSYRTVTPERVNDEDGFVIPLIGSLQYRSFGYSQGYSIVLNDMHGKPKASYSYASKYWSNTHKTAINEDGYRKKVTYVYNIDKGQLIDSFKADFHKGDGSKDINEYKGIHYEMYADVRENFTYSINGGAAINAGVDPTPMAVFVSAFPAISMNVNNMRTIATTKVVNRSSFLKEVITSDVGIEEKVKNLLFDLNSGQVVMTQTTSDWDQVEDAAYDDVTYSYTMPAYGKGNYQTMGMADFNYRLSFNVTLSGGNFTVPDAAKYFAPGDELFSSSGTNRRYWINSVSGSTVNVKLRDGSNAANGTYTFTIMRSGNRNLQDVAAATIVSLQNPSVKGNYAIFEHFNMLMAQYLAGSTTPPASQSFDISDCLGTRYKGSLQLLTGPGPSVRFVFDPPTGCPECYTASDCGGSIPSLEFDIPVQPSEVSSLNDFRGVRLYVYEPQGQKGVRVDYVDGSNSVTEYQASGKFCTMDACMKGVLNAGAVEFRQSHSFAASDYTLPAWNGFANGTQGVWRMLRSNAYLTDRLQSAPSPAVSLQFPTFAGKDGEYKAFTEFKHQTGNSGDVQFARGWRWVSQVPAYGYSPNGELLMSENRLQLPTSFIYDYKRLLPVMSAANADMREIAFSSFETTLVPYSVGGGGNGSELAFSNVNPTRLSNFLIQSSTTSPLHFSKYEGHSGNQSLFIGPNSNIVSGVAIPVLALPPSAPFQQDNTSYPLQMKSGGKKYLLSFWFKNSTTQESVGIYGIGFNGSTYDFTSPQVKISEHVDGWRKLEFVYEISTSLSTATPYSINIIAIPSTYLDDLRIQPYESEAMGMVYDARSFLPKSQLDRDNYTMKISYDEENKPVIMKTETSKGIYSTFTNRGNTSQK